MAMSATERKVLLGVIASLRGRPSTSPEVVEALQGPCRLFLESYVIGPLEIIAAEKPPLQRDMKTALYMSLYEKNR